MITDHHRAFTVFIEHPFSICTAVLAVLGVATAVVLGLCRLARSASRRDWQGEQVGTLLAAAIATGVSAQGMWVFMGDALHLTTGLRVMFFGFLETMTVTSALRARTAQRATDSAGVDGIAMWVLTSLSAVLSATEADNLGALLIRLSAPLVAAWGWERSMALEHRVRIGHHERINWRFTPQRMLIRLGLAGADAQCDASDLAVQRSLIAVALAVDDARALREDNNASPRKMRKAQQRLRSAMRHATADAGLVPFAGRDRRAVLLDQIAVLRSTSALLDVDVPMPWPGIGKPDSPAPVLRIDAQDNTVTVPDRVEQASGSTRSSHAGSGEQKNNDAAVRSNGALQRTMAGEPGALGDHQKWAMVAEQVCADDPARRRRPGEVEAILRLHHLEHRTYPQIAQQVDGISKHAVGRVIRQARKYTRTSTHTQAKGLTNERA